MAFSSNYSAEDVRRRSLVLKFPKEKSNNNLLIIFYTALFHLVRKRKKQGDEQLDYLEVNCIVYLCFIIKIIEKSQERKETTHQSRGIFQHS